MILITKRKALIFCLTVFIIVFATGLYILQNNMIVVRGIREPYVIDWTLNETISCHYMTDGDALPSAEEVFPPPDSIFFHETSCKGGLNSRQACSVESAARIHPERNVYLFFNSPVTEYVLSRSCLGRLKQFKNIKIARLYAAEYAKGTPLAELLANKKNSNGQFNIEHTSDMLRFITLYKNGGVYLDTDMLLVRRLDDLGKNWAGREDNSSMNVAAVAIGRDELGHNLVKGILESIKDDYRPDLWSHTGPGAMNDALMNFCNSTSISELNGDICHGFQVYDASMLYPIHYSELYTYFAPGDIPEKASNAYTHHMWNRLTYEIKVEPGSPYEKLARKYCPTIWSMFGHQFGT